MTRLFAEIPTEIPMKTMLHSCVAGLTRRLLSALIIPVLTTAALSADRAEIEKLFHDYATAKRDDKIGNKLTALKDDAVDFLCEVIRKKEPHPVEYLTVDGKERHMGTWSQEAGTILMSIDTPKVVAEA